MVIIGAKSGVKMAFLKLNLPLSLPLRCFPLSEKSSTPQPERG